ncbi:MAG: RecT family protein [Bacteriophage sp.]|nr:MAG: RecT family protein [Bacteriophage sp.]
MTQALATQQTSIAFTDDVGANITVTADDVRNLICPNADQKEVALFLQLCKSQRFNPFVKDAYLVKYGSNPAQMITNYQVFNRRACKNENYAGIENGVVVLRNGEIVHKDGSAVYKAAGETLLGGWAKVYFKDNRKPAYAEVALDDYSTGKSNWSKMPGVMIEKCAKAAAWRLAFPDDFQGMYVSEEMHQAQPQQVDSYTEPVQAFADPAPIKQLMPMYVIAEYGEIEDSAKRKEAFKDATSNLVALTNAADMHHLSEKDVRVIVSHMEECIANPSVKPVVSEPIPIEVEPEIIPEPVEYEESF